MEKIIKKNQVTVSGKMVSEFSFSHEVYGEKFYIADLSVERMSGKCDIIPVMVSDRLIDTDANRIGGFLKISGQLRSYNKHEENKNRLILSVFAREFEEIEFEHEEPGSGNDENNILLDGYICKKPSCRKTPLGREISDILLAVNRPYGKSDYIPCIAWGRNAVYASGLEVGTRLQIEGRIQSREYQKRISDDKYETRTAYEVSISILEVTEDEQSKD